MKLISLSLENFGSYDSLSHDFMNQGLSLIYGVTGSGKSTLLDGVMWVLFGETAKNGGVDDIKSWNSPNAPVKGTLCLSHRLHPRLTIARIRGNGANDLYWQENHDSEQKRGKDITETQRFLNDHLGLNSYVYSLGAYYNEVSPAALFFTAKSSERRQLFESIADLSFPTTLMEKIVESKKSHNSQLRDLMSSSYSTKGKIQQLENTREKTKQKFHGWKIEQDQAINDVGNKMENWDADIAKQLEDANNSIKEFEDERLIKIDELNNMWEKTQSNFIDSTRCASCGAMPNERMDELGAMKTRYAANVKKEENRVNPYLAIKERILKSENIYNELLEKLVMEKNPYASSIQDNKEEMKSLQYTEKQIDASIGQVHDTISSLEQLNALTELLRAELIKNTIKSVEYETNRLLEQYFNSEVRVRLVLLSKDRIDVLGQVSGHDCPYTQFSKGQKGLLKFTFGCAVMKAVSNNCGVDFGDLFLDEPLDGCDVSLKTSAFNLFTELAKDRNGVMVIDHSEELQNLFERKYLVEINGGVSDIKEIL